MNVVIKIGRRGRRETEDIRAIEGRHSDIRRTAAMKLAG